MIFEFPLNIVHFQWKDGRFLSRLVKINLKRVKRFFMLQWVNRYTDCCVMLCACPAFTRYAPIVYLPTGRHANWTFNFPRQKFFTTRKIFRYLTFGGAVFFLLFICVYLCFMTSSKMSLCSSYYTVIKHICWKKSLSNK